MLYPQEIDPKTGKKGLLVDTGVPTEAWTAEQAKMPLLAAQTEYYKTKGQDGKYTMVPGTGQDENGNVVQGTYTFDAKTGEKSFEPGVTVTGKGGKSAPSPEDKAALEGEKTRAKMWATNKQYLDAVSDDINLMENSAQSYSPTGFLTHPIDNTKNANTLNARSKQLALDLSKIDKMPGNNAGVTGLQTLLASKPGITNSQEYNINQLQAYKAKVDSVYLNNDINTAFHQIHPNPAPADLGVRDQVEEALKKQYPLATINGNVVTHHPENRAKIQSLIPDALANPQKYLGGGQPTNIPAAQVAPQAQPSAIPPPQQREAGKVYSTPKGNLTWTGTGWVQQK